MISGKVNFLRLLLGSGLFLFMVFGGGVSLSDAQVTFRGEILAPAVVIRVKPRPARSAALPKPGKTATYGANQYHELFEDALTEGNNSLASKDFAAAVLDFERARALTTDDPRPSIGAAFALVEKGDVNTALARAQEAQRFVESPEVPLPASATHTADADQLYSLLGYVYLRMGQFGDALTAYGKMSALDGPAGVVLYNNRGIAYANLANYSEGEEQFQRAQALDQKNQSVRMNRGLLYVLLRNREKAVAVQQEFAGTDPYRAGVLQREIENMRPPTEP